MRRRVSCDVSHVRCEMIWCSMCLLDDSCVKWGHTSGFTMILLCSVSNLHLVICQWSSRYLRRSYLKTVVSPLPLTTSPSSLWEHDEDVFCNTSSAVETSVNLLELSPAAPVHSSLLCVQRLHPPPSTLLLSASFSLLWDRDQIYWLQVALIGISLWAQTF